MENCVIPPITTPSTSTYKKSRIKMTTHKAWSDHVPILAFMNKCHHDNLKYKCDEATTSTGNYSTVTLWEDDLEIDMIDTMNLDGVHSQQIELNKDNDRFIPFLDRWLKGNRNRLKQQQQGKSTSQVQKNVPLVPVPHPLRTDLYEIHCKWRGFAKKSNYKRRQRNRRKKRSLWTSRLAFVNDNNSNNKINNFNYNFYNNNNNDTLPIRSIYDCNTFYFEFDPLGYVRVLISSSSSSHDNNNKTKPLNVDHDRKKTAAYEFDHQCNNDSNKYIDLNCIGTWKLTSNGLTVTIPIDIQRTGRTIETTTIQQRQQHTMEMDYHMNPFGKQPKLARGIVFLENETNTNFIMQLFNLRPIVATFTGKGIGKDTVDLSYQKRL
jgi:hypothetical protein